MSLNQIVIMGRFTQSPELRSTQNGNFVTNFCLAVERDFIDKATNNRDADFINCVAYGKTAEFIKKYFDKGSMAIVTGRLQIRQWVDKNETKRYTSEVIANTIYFGESKQKSEQNSLEQNNMTKTFGEIEAKEEDLPF